MHPGRFYTKRAQRFSMRQPLEIIEEEREPPPAPPPSLASSSSVRTIRSSTPFLTPPQSPSELVGGTKTPSHLIGINLRHARSRSDELRKSAMKEHLRMASIEREAVAVRESLRRIGQAFISLQDELDQAEGVTERPESRAQAVERIGRLMHLMDAEEAARPESALLPPELSHALIQSLPPPVPPKASEEGWEVQYGQAL